MKSKVPLQGAELEEYLQKERAAKEKEAAEEAVLARTQRMLEADEGDSESDESEDEEGLDEESLAGRSGREPSFSIGASSSASFMEDGFLARLDKMSSELDALVRFVRRGVESLAAGTGEAAPAFGIFAFALEDWDR